MATRSESSDWTVDSESAQLGRGGRDREGREKLNAAGGGRGDENRGLGGATTVTVGEETEGAEEIAVEVEIRRLDEEKEADDKGADC